MRGSIFADGLILLFLIFVDEHLKTHYNNSYYYCYDDLENIFHNRITANQKGTFPAFILWY